MIKWRWVVERTFAWLGRCRIHSRDYERKPTSSEAQVQISMIQLMLRRLAGEKHEAPFRYPRPAEEDRCMRFMEQTALGRSGAAAWPGPLPRLNSTGFVPSRQFCPCR